MALIAVRGCAMKRTTSTTMKVEASPTSPT